MSAAASSDLIERRIDALLVGAIDPHVHSGPSIANRAVDHLELARDCSKVGMAAIVTKDHDYAGVMTAWLINKHHPELTTKVYSSIVLNNVVGGLNPYAVTAEQHFKWEKTSGWVHPASTSKIRPAMPIPVLDARRKVNDATKEILDICAKTGMALASGHIHASETLIVFEEARRRGVERLIFTHPEDIVGGTPEDARAAVEMGAYIEHSLCMFLEGCKFKSCDAGLLKDYIEAAGVDRTILCSDLGQVGVFHPIDGFRRGIRLCIEFGYSDEDIRKMVSNNAARMLGIEEDLPERAVA
jgi:hypothetical protein